MAAKSKHQELLSDSSFSSVFGVCWKYQNLVLTRIKSRFVLLLEYPTSNNHGLKIRCFRLSGCRQSYANLIPASPVINPALREFGGIKFTDLRFLVPATSNHSTMQQWSQRSAYSVVQESPVDWMQYVRIAEENKRPFKTPLTLRD